MSGLTSLLCFMMMGMTGLIVNIPTVVSPLVMVNKTLPISHINYAGSILTLNCSATISTHIDTPVKISFKWRRGKLPLINSSQAIINDFIDNEMRIYSSIIHFPMLSASMDTGNYNCDVTLDYMTSLNHKTNFSVTTTAMIFINVSIPPLSVQVFPRSLRRLDQAPFNSFEVSCVCNIPPDVSAIKTLFWRAGTNFMGNVVLPTTANGSNEVSLIFEELDGGVLYSVLKVVTKVPGDYLYSCEAELRIKRDDPVAAFSTTSVHIQGVASPIPAINLTANRASLLSSAKIMWIIQEISYLPEDYTIQYSTDRNFVNSLQKLILVAPNVNLEEKNRNYSVIIENLEIGREYFYRIQSENNVRVSTSDTAQFTAGFSSSLFQLKFSGVRDCEQWMFSNAQQKIQDVVDGVITYLNDQCICGVTSDHIQESKFICTHANPTAVIYRARLFAPFDISEPQQLVQTLQQWVESDIRSFIIAGFLLVVDQSCNVVINSFNDAECRITTSSVIMSTMGAKPSQTPTSEEPWPVIAMIVIAIIVITAVAIGVAGSILAVLKWKSRRKQQTYQDTTREAEDENYDQPDDFQIAPPRLPLRTHQFTTQACPAYFKVDVTNCVAYEMRMLNQAEVLETENEDTAADETYEYIDGAST